MGKGESLPVPWWQEWRPAKCGWQRPERTSAGTEVASWLSSRWPGAWFQSAFLALEVDKIIEAYQRLPHQRSHQQMQRRRPTHHGVGFASTVWHPHQLLSYSFQKVQRRVAGRIEHDFIPTTSAAPDLSPNWTSNY